MRLKLLLGLAAVIAAVIMPSGYYAQQRINQAIQSEYEGQAKAAMAVFRTTIIEHGHDLKAIQKQADVLKRSNPIYERLHYHIWRKNRTMTAVSTDRSEIGRPSDKADGRPFVTGKLHVKREHGEVEIHEPVIIHGKVRGTVGAYFKAPTADFGHNLVFDSLLLVAVLSVVYALLNRMIIAPIRKLEQAAAAVAQGAIAVPIETNRRDEFGSLAGRFNEMLAALQVQDRENRTLQQKLKDSFDQAHLEANTDTLTQLFNRRYLEKQLKTVVSQAGILGRQMACVFCDLDGFKNYNDIFGHQKGDEALRTVGIIIKACLRESDIAARYGGEEFALVLPDTDLDGTRAVADRIRRAVANFAGERKQGQPALTMSIGIAMCKSKDLSASQLIHQADVAMYSAKKSGKNCIVIYNEAELEHQGRRS